MQLRIIDPRIQPLRISLTNASPILLFAWGVWGRICTILLSNFFQIVFVVDIFEWRFSVIFTTIGTLPTLMSTLYFCWKFHLYLTSNLTSGGKKQIKEILIFMEMALKYIRLKQEFLTIYMYLFCFSSVWTFCRKMNWFHVVSKYFFV